MWSAFTVPRARRGDDAPTRLRVLLDGAGLVSMSVGTLVALSTVLLIVGLVAIQLVSRTLPDAPDPEVEIVRDDPVAAVRALKAEPGRDILLAGGAQLAGTLLGEVDELVVKLYPVVAGAGVPQFTAPFTPTALTLTSSRVLERGTLMLTYDLDRG